MTELKRTFSAKCIAENRFDAAMAAFREEAEAHFGGAVKESRRIKSHHGNVTVFLAKADPA